MRDLHRKAIRTGVSKQPSMWLSLRNAAGWSFYQVDPFSWLEGNTGHWSDTQRLKEFNSLPYIFFSTTRDQFFQVLWSRGSF